MPKPGVVSGARQRREQRSADQLPNVEGQIAEICRDLAVEAKRMRQLQEQADELRTVIREWVGELQPQVERAPASRAGRR